MFRHLQPQESSLKPNAEGSCCFCVYCVYVSLLDKKEMIKKLSFLKQTILLIV